MPWLFLWFDEIGQSHTFHQADHFFTGNVSHVRRFVIPLDIFENDLPTSEDAHAPFACVNYQYGIMLAIIQSHLQLVERGWENQWSWGLLSIAISM